MARGEEEEKRKGKHRSALRALKNIRVGDSGSVNQGLSDAIQRQEFSSGQAKEDQVR